MPSNESELTRRTMLSLAGAGALTAVFGLPRSLFAQPAPAAPTVNDPSLQGAGFFNFALGEATVSVVSDGGFVMKPGEVFPEVTKDELEDVAKAAHVSTDGFPGQINALVVRRGSDVILIDTGSGRNFGPTAGFLVSNLANAGVKPADVTHVILSHAHPDHVGGLLTAEGKPTFARAKVFANKAEHDFWTGPNPQVTSAILQEKLMPTAVPIAQKAFAAVKDSLELVNPGDTVAGVVKLIEAYGHTPGHVALSVGTADGPKLTFLGDAIFILPLQLKHPEWHGFYDGDPIAAALTRRKLFETAAEDRSLVSSAHMPFPAAGYFDRDGDDFRWTARPWTWGAE